MSDIETLILEKEKKVIVSGKEFLISDLGLSQIFRLKNLIAKIMSESLSKFKNLSQGKDNKEDFINFFNLLSENEAIELLAIILNTNDLVFCKNLKSGQVFDIIATFLEVFDWENIKKNFQRIKIAIQKNQNLN